MIGLIKQTKSNLIFLRLDYTCDVHFFVVVVDFSNIQCFAKEWWITHRIYKSVNKIYVYSNSKNAEDQNRVRARWRDDSKAKKKIVFLYLFMWFRFVLYIFVAIRTKPKEREQTYWPWLCGICEYIPILRLECVRWRFAPISLFLTHSLCV